MSTRAITMAACLILTQFESNDNLHFVVRYRSTSQVERYSPYDPPISSISRMIRVLISDIINSPVFTTSPSTPFGRPVPWSNVSNTPSILALICDGSNIEIYIGKFCMHLLAALHYARIVVLELWNRRRDGRQNCRGLQQRMGLCSSPVSVVVGCPRLHSWQRGLEWQSPWFSFHTWLESA